MPLVWCLNVYIPWEFEKQLCRKKNLEIYIIFKLEWINVSLSHKTKKCIIKIFFKIPKTPFRFKKHFQLLLSMSKTPYRLKHMIKANRFIVKHTFMLFNNFYLMYIFKNIMCWSVISGGCVHVLMDLNRRKYNEPNRCTVAVNIHEYSRLWPYLIHPSRV